MLGGFTLYLAKNPMTQLTPSHRVWECLVDNLSYYVVLSTQLNPEFEQIKENGVFLVLDGSSMGCQMGVLC